MSWFSSLKPGENITTPAQQLRPGAAPFGPLTDEDLFWTCSTSIITETQVWYATLPDGRIAMCQIIHSGVGLWQVQIQFTFGLYDVGADGAPVRNWKSVPVTGFTCPASAQGGTTYDRRSVHSDQFRIVVDPARPDTYSIKGKYDDDVTIDLEYTRLPGVPGWKLGAGPRGGVTYFGAVSAPKAPSTPGAPDLASGADGYCVHRFWPRCSVGGTIVHKGERIALDSATTRGAFIHAIQGMRPNLVASRWNFCDFQAAADDKAALVLMEFTACHAYGDRKITVGSVVVDDKLVAVVAGPQVGHKQAVLDKETGYQVPRRIVFPFSGPAIADPKAAVTAELALDLPPNPKQPQAGGWSSEHLVSRVSVLAEMPSVVRKVVQATGTNPYIYQWLVKGAEATISVPALDGQPARELKLRGTTYAEATFISEP